jgi:hypothetical protein
LVSSVNEENEKNGASVNKENEEDDDNDSSGDISARLVPVDSTETQSLASSAARLVASLTSCTDNDGSGDVSASLASVESIAP